MTEGRGRRAALVSSVTPGSPAERAGLERGDVILRLDGREIADGNALRNEVSRTMPGSRVELTSPARAGARGASGGSLFLTLQNRG